MLKGLYLDIQAVKKNDPAARNIIEIIFTYAGFHALLFYRIAHLLWKVRCKFLARLLSQIARFLTGVEIHPAAKIAHGVFIDHGTGVVIGETAEVKTGVVLYQGVTLGGRGNQKGKRHPTVEEGAVIGAGAKVLGSFTVGKYAKIGAGAVVLCEVPPFATAVGVPAKIIEKKLEE